jgi:hypothetical protein
MPAVRELVAEMRRLREEEIALRGKSVNDTAQYRLYAPADDATITEHEASSGAQYSPAYREFLEMSNGWLGFWPDWSLIGVPRAENRDMYADVSDTLSIIPDELDASEQAKLIEEEKHDAKRILATNHMIFATNFNGGLMVFDRNRVDVAGEPEAVWVGYIYHVERRYPSFAALLEYAIADTRKEIARLRQARG